VPEQPTGEETTDSQGRGASARRQLEAQARRLRRERDHLDERLRRERERVADRQSYEDDQSEVEAASGSYYSDGFGDAKQSRLQEQD